MSPDAPRSTRATSKLTFGSTTIRLADGETLIARASGGIRAIGRIGILTAIRYYVLRHRSEIVFTSRRVCLLRKNTRDWSAQTVSLATVASVSALSQYGTLSLIKGMLYLGAGTALLGAAYATLAQLDLSASSSFLQSFLDSLSREERAYSAAALLAVSALLLLAGLLQLIHRVSTHIRIETTGGSRLYYNASGSGQKNGISRAVERLNDTMAADAHGLS